MPEQDVPPDVPQFDIDEEFQAAASPRDLRGRINFRTEQALQQEIEDIADDSRYPLRSMSEVIRYCCIVGLQRLRLWKPAPTLLGQIRMANALLARDKLQCESLELLERMDERIQWYVAHKHYDEVIELVARVRSYFDGLPAEFWSDHIQQQLDERFIQWMDKIDAERDK